MTMMTTIMVMIPEAKEVVIVTEAVAEKRKGADMKMIIEGQAEIEKEKKEGIETEMDITKDEVTKVIKAIHETGTTEAEGQIETIEALLTRIVADREDETFIVWINNI